MGVSKIVTIGGPSNSGKTTVSGLLAEMLPQTVRIELDATNLIPNDFPKEAGRWARWREPCVIEDLVSLTVNWLNRRFDVILPGLFWKGTYDLMRDILLQQLGEHPVEYHSFVLAPPLEVALRPRGSRLLDEDMHDFIREQYDTGLQDPGFGMVIDNQGQTPEQTADLIARHIADGTAKSSC